MHIHSLLAVQYWQIIFNALPTEVLQKPLPNWTQTYLHNVFHRKNMKTHRKTKEWWHIVSCFHTLNLIPLTTFFLCPHCVLVLEANARFHPYLELFWFALIAVTALSLFWCVFSLLRSWLDSNSYLLTTYRYLKACYQKQKYAYLKCEFWGWNNLFPFFMQPKHQLCIWKSWRYLILHISGSITPFYCCDFTLFATVPLLYSFCVNFHCKIIVRAVSSVCTILAEWRTPSLETWLRYDNKQWLTEAEILSIYYFSKNSRMKAWWTSLETLRLWSPWKVKTSQKSTKPPIPMSRSMSGGYVFTFSISECYPKHTRMFRFFSYPSYKLYQQLKIMGCTDDLKVYLKQFIRDV